MTNLSKIKRDNMIAFLEELKQQHKDDSSIRAFNEIENHLRDKKYGIVWEEHSEKVDELLKDNIPILTADSERRLCKDKNLPWNFIIEGDNLQALYLLEKTHKGKIDCIYIDPPYNTGAKDWKYNNDYVDDNDVFRHSKWLSMMDKRLMIAKGLLSKDGALICAIDENEVQTLGLLLREIFPEHSIDCIAVVHNPGGIQGANFSYCHEYAYFVYPKRSYYITKEMRNADVTLAPFRDWGKENSKRAGSPNCFYPIVVDINSKSVIRTGSVPDDDFHPGSANEMHDNEIWVWPIDAHGVERRWRFAYDTVNEILDELVPIEIDGIINIKRKKKWFTRKTVWSDPLFTANNSGTQLLSKILGKRFSYPKSLYLVRECLRACNQNPNATILDFFAGSGTTMHAVNLLNAEDGGNRRCILVTNNEIGVDDEKIFAKEHYGNEHAVKWTKSPSEKGAKFTINYASSEFLDFKDSHGIAKYVTWPRLTCSILGVDKENKSLKGNYITNIVEKKTSSGKNVIQIKYISNPMSLTGDQKKNLVSTLCGKKLPQSCVVGNDCKYAFSEESKHTASILFDDSVADEWLEAISVNKKIDTFYVITTNKKIFQSVKKKIQSEIATIYETKYNLRPMAEGFEANVKYFKCDWTQRKPEDYFLSNALCLHVKEMIELQNAIEIDNIRNVLLLNKADFKNIIMNPKIYGNIEKIWVNQNIIFNSKEMELLEAKGYKFIPREFFGQELKEVAE